MIPFIIFGVALAVFPPTSTARWVMDGAAALVIGLALMRVLRWAVHRLLDKPVPQ